MEFYWIFLSLDISIHSIEISLWGFNFCYFFREITLSKHFLKTNKVQVYQSLIKQSLIWEGIASSAFWSRVDSLIHHAIMLLWICVDFNQIFLKYLFLIRMLLPQAVSLCTFSFENVESSSKQNKTKSANDLKLHKVPCFSLPLLVFPFFPQIYF